MTMVLSSRRPTRTRTGEMASAGGRHGDGLACVGQAIVTELDPARSGHAKGSGRSEEDTMHPMFVKLFLEADTDLPAEEEDKRHRANQARRTRSRMVIRVAACDRKRGSQPS